MRCTGGTISLLYATPAPGWTMHGARDHRTRRSRGPFRTRRGCARDRGPREGDAARPACRSRRSATAIDYEVTATRREERAQRGDELWFGHGGEVIARHHREGGRSIGDRVGEFPSFAGEVVVGPDEHQRGHADRSEIGIVEWMTALDGGERSSVGMRCVGEGPKRCPGRGLDVIGVRRFQRVGDGSLEGTGIAKRARLPTPPSTRRFDARVARSQTTRDHRSHRVPDHVAAHHVEEVEQRLHVAHHRLVGVSRGLVWLL